MRYQVVLGVRDIVIQYMNHAKLFATFPYWRFVLDDFLVEIGKSGTDLDLSPEAIAMHLESFWYPDAYMDPEEIEKSGDFPPLEPEGWVIMSQWLSAMLLRIVERWDSLFCTLPPRSFCYEVKVAGWVGLDLLLEFYFNTPTYRVAGVPDF